MGKDRKFTSPELYELLNSAMGKTLGEVDVNHVFKKTNEHPKVTGIAGDVVEQSVLGFPADNKAEPDIDVDGQLIEVKTTGIRVSKTKKGEFEAKEPVSVTGVSPETIVNETFYNSKFWHKLKKILFVYYEYSSDKPVTAAEYAKFLLRGYDFYKFSNRDEKILKNDWQLVRNFIKDLRSQPGFNDEEYARLSHELRDKLMYIDTAPKWPNSPRFRLKRSLVTTIVQEHFSKKRLKQDVEEICNISELNATCHELTSKYKGKTVKYLAEEFNIPPTTGKSGKANKSIVEKVIVRMFGGKSAKINSLDVFRKSGIYGKTIILSNKGGRTEDTKLFTINFDEWLDKEVSFEESQIFEYFSNNKLLCIQFKETKPGDLLESKFVGFKLLSFDDNFINEYAKWIWNKVRSTIFDGELKESICKKDGQSIINPCGTTKTKINFPKSSDNMKLFLRGSGQDSTHKTLQLCGIQMYQQQVWIKGTEIVELLKEKEYL